MIDEPQIVQTEPQLIAFIHLTVPREEIRQVMGPGLGELREVLSAQRVASTGPWFTHHMKKPADSFDFDICVPVAVTVKPSGRVKAGELPARRVARSIYHGPYENLGAAWGEFEAWIVANGHTPEPDLWECYAAGPESSPDPANWRTELNRPLTSSASS